MKTSLCGLLLIGFQREVVPAQFDGRQHGDTEESAAMNPVHSMHPFRSEMVNCKSTWQLATSADLSSIHTSIMKNASPTVQKHHSTPWPLRVPHSTASFERSSKASWPFAWVWSRYTAGFQRSWIALEFFGGALKLGELAYSKIFKIWFWRSSLVDRGAGSGGPEYFLCLPSS